MHLVMAQVLANRGVDGFVFRGDDGLDEITLATTTSVLTIGNGEIFSDLLDPLDFNIPRAPISELVGGDSTENARITMAIFSGETGAPRDAVVLNAAAAIAAFDARFDLTLHERMALGVSRAIEAIDSGASTRLVAEWSRVTQKLGA
jgi:anthranilate phosphoribosyltransferase